MCIKLDKLKYLIEEYEELERVLDKMYEGWDSDNPCWAAESDPALQYEKGVELEDKYDEIKKCLNDL